MRVGRDPARAWLRLQVLGRCASCGLSACSTYAAVGEGKFDRSERGNFRKKKEEASSYKAQASSFKDSHSQLTLALRSEKLQATRHKRQASKRQRVWTHALRSEKLSGYKTQATSFKAGNGPDSRLALTTRTPIRKASSYKNQAPSFKAATGLDSRLATHHSH